MMAMKVLVRPGKTFRMNLAVCSSFNADFDGDELNIHAPQFQESRAELEELSSSKYNMISPQASKPNIRIVQDSLVALYLMTKDYTKIHQERFFQIASHGDGWTPNFILEGIQRVRRVTKDKKGKATAFTGKGLVSLMLPPDFVFEKRTNVDPNEPYLRIYRGVIYEGGLNKDILGGSHNTIMQSLHKNYGVEVAYAYVNNLQFIANAWMSHYGFSVSIKDCIAEKDDEVQIAVAKCLVEADSISMTTHNPVIREAKINNALNKAKDIGMKIAKDALKSDNKFIETVKSGAKGDYFNIAQITGLLGQQNVTGNRIQPVLNKNRRILPHYPNLMSSEQEYESRGFIRSSFIKGMKPREFFFHAMPGRESISDTAMKTANSGYVQRRMIKVLEDVKVCYDGTVRSSNGNIIQFAFGGNCMDGTSMVKTEDGIRPVDIRSIVNILNLNHELERSRVKI